MRPQQTAQRVVFSGDLGAPNTPLLPAPQPPVTVDSHDDHLRMVRYLAQPGPQGGHPAVVIAASGLCAGAGW
ncbi:hypothetical protein U5801_04275 [Lamprobacter modestohalophilus]|uniref:hypothetical protein n=1 Tax=Lamprobacter modestohalophilus TaxID=1064514 RepID=UPI002ADEA8D8|nr:hypothetical protein [Lamprobacter modestohalophilus]MEA1049028.1 hypothetical protein [Lamprobacter modestohalophilus]